MNSLANTTRVRRISSKIDRASNKVKPYRKTPYDRKLEKLGSPSSGLRKGIDNIDINQIPRSNSTNGSKAHLQEACAAQDSCSTSQVSLIKPPSIDQQQTPGPPTMLEYETSAERTTGPNLLSIPAEIRMIIYRACLISPIQVRLTDAYQRSIASASSSSQSSLDELDHNHPTPLENTNHRSSEIEAALLRTCRRIYNEARSILYAENTFILEGEQAVESLALLHQRTRAQIRTMHISLDNKSLQMMPTLLHYGLAKCWQLRFLTLNLDAVVVDNVSSIAVKVSSADLQLLPSACRVRLISDRNEKLRDVMAKHWKDSGVTLV